jgi:Ran GTPase-activating protein (RanGAP) involved in mRNA processing and transport
VQEFNPALSRSRLNNKSRTKSTHNQSQSEREGTVLGERNDNLLKRKKLELPEKYLRVYEELMKDRLEVVDLGGAFLGESTVLAISDLFPSRAKLRTAKLMNNKIGDDAFPELLARCRHLTSLNLSYNLLSEKSLDVLEQQAGSLGELRNITLSNNKIVLRHVRERLDGLARRGIKVSL